MRRIRIPKNFEVQPLKPGENPPGKTTCGSCGLSWDDDKPTTWTPAPSGRCPFEYFHVYPKEKKPRIWVKNTVPTVEGWYWIKYHGKHGLTKAPASVTWFKSGEFVVRTGYGSTFCTHDIKNFGVFWFGPAIPVPK